MRDDIQDFARATIIILVLTAFAFAVVAWCR